MRKTVVETEITQWSEDAEVKYYEDGTIRVENYDTEVDFTKEVSGMANYNIDTNGNIDIIPFGCKENARRGPRAITVCDTGVARARKSPKGQNVRIDILLPAKLATKSNFLNHFNALFAKIKEKDIDLKNC